MSRCYRAALAYARAGDLSAAARCARAALGADAQDTLARRLLGLCLYESGDLAAALPYLENTELGDAARRELSGTREAFSLAAGHMRRGKWRKALRGLASLRASARVQNARGCLYALARRYAQAEGCFARALTADKGNGNAARCLGALPPRPARGPLSFLLGGANHG
jgi:tetratricopeptide (TPR) repeat protein